MRIQFSRLVLSFEKILSGNYLQFSRVSNTVGLSAQYHFVPERNIQSFKNFFRIFAEKARVQIFQLVFVTRQAANVWTPGGRNIFNSILIVSSTVFGVSVHVLVQVLYEFTDQKMASNNKENDSRHHLLDATKFLLLQAWCQWCKMLSKPKRKSEIWMRWTKWASFACHMIFWQLPVDTAYRLGDAMWP